MKRCTKCGECKPLTEFYKQKNGRDGLRGDCKVCFAKRAKQWYANNREQAIDRVRAWQKAHPERVREQLKKTRSRRKEVWRDTRLRKTFGLTADQYSAMLATQGGGCAVCGRKPREDRSLHVDHDHGTRVVRGLLCFSCNAGLGQFRDDPTRLVDAVFYLMGSLPVVDPNGDERGLLVSLIAELGAGGAPVRPLVDDARRLAVDASPAGSDNASE